MSNDKLIKRPETSPAPLSTADDSTHPSAPPKATELAPFKRPTYPTLSERFAQWVAEATPELPTWAKIMIAILVAVGVTAAIALAWFVGHAFYILGSGFLIMTGAFFALRRGMIQREKRLLDEVDDHARKQAALAVSSAKAQWQYESTRPDIVGAFAADVIAAGIDLFVREQQLVSVQSSGQYVFTGKLFVVFQQLIPRAFKIHFRKGAVFVMGDQLFDFGPLDPWDDVFPYGTTAAEHDVRVISRQDAAAELSKLFSAPTRDGAEVTILVECTVDVEGETCPARPQVRVLTKLQKQP